MPYQTGAASSSVDLLQQLVTFLAANGWTQDRSATEGSGWTATLHNAGTYAHFRAVLNEHVPWIVNHDEWENYALDLYLGTGYISGNPWNNQTTGAPVGSAGNPVGVGMHLTAGPFTNYYFFCDTGGSNVVVVVEVSAGLYVHLGFGLSLQKAGAWTGGPYFFGSTSGFWSSNLSPGAGKSGMTATSDCPFVNGDYESAVCGFVRADVDAFTGKWIGIEGAGGTTGADVGYQGKLGASSVRSSGGGGDLFYPVYSYHSYAYEFQNEQTSTLDGRANLLPILLYANRDATASGFSLLGSAPFVFVCNAVGHGFSAGDEYVLGETTYKIFPNFAIVKQ